MLEMEQSEGFFDEVRMTDDGRYSVLDIIKFCGNKSPGKKWASMVKDYPDLLGKSDNYKFPGKGQQFTPSLAVKAFYILLVYCLDQLDELIDKKRRKSFCSLLMPLQN